MVLLIVLHDSWVLFEIYGRRSDKPWNGENFWRICRRGIENKNINFQSKPGSKRLPYSAITFNVGGVLMCCANTVASSPLEWITFLFCTCVAFLLVLICGTVEVSLGVEDANFSCPAINETRDSNRTKFLYQEFVLLYGNNNIFYIYKNNDFNL